MTHLFVNGLAASAGGGLTYLRNVLPQLAARDDVRTTVALAPSLQREMQHLRNVSWVEVGITGGSALRLWREQSLLPYLIRKSGADVLISTGNFALKKSPVPQILLSRNSLYTSQDFFNDLAARRDYRLLLDTRVKRFLAKRSMSWADCTVAPSESFAQELRQWSGANVTSIHHGFDPEIFFRDPTPLSSDVQARLTEAQCSLKLLFVSHYNYYRNFETLFRALSLLKKRLGSGKVKLILTCRLRAEENPGLYKAEKAHALVNELGIADDVIELGSVPYRQLHQLYRACDVYVTPAYAESFAHPLVEAMASGLPIVASDLPVHREICEGAALFFQRFSPDNLADQVSEVEHSADLKEQLTRQGRRRSTQFSWADHAQKILQLAQSLIARHDVAAVRVLHKAS